MKYFKVFGARRSGAFYLKTLLEDNIEDITFFTEELGPCYDSPMDLVGTKNWIARNKRDLSPKSTGVLNQVVRKHIEINPIVIIKDPYTWFKSISRWYGKKKFDLINSYKAYNELYKGCEDLLENPKKYEKMYKNCMLIKYEDLLRDPESVILRICNSYEIPMSNIRTPLEITNKIKNSAKFTKRAREIYLSTGPYKIDTWTINYITRQVDWDTVGTYYGYYPMDPRDFHNFSRKMHAQITKEMRDNEVIPILSKYGADRRVGVRVSSIF